MAAATKGSAMLWRSRFSGHRSPASQATMAGPCIDADNCNLWRCGGREEEICCTDVARTLTFELNPPTVERVLLYE
jgi:hypothetical protein